ncbi:hypothetical protein CDL15_Pgr021012 [Punica granatum]|uniref:Uncharacterized protein n=1 Tax=Punica granatum TaxID=22663 RepID=A0A218Y073_PUNGR|nr:hypothetical protein CDL15_Pgr021012 [Punica granatum]
MPLASLTQDDYLGVYGIMFWILAFIRVVKYTCIAFDADDQGEGGTFLLCKNMNIGIRNSKRIDSNSTISKTTLPADRKTRLAKFIKRSINYVGIFEALSPVYIVRYFMRNRKHGCHLGVPCSVLQSVVLDYFPRVKVVHTSSSNEGEVYSPEVNYILTVLCVTVILIFGEWKDVGNAFGVVVGLVMLITTVLLTLVMITIWRTPVVLVALYFTVFFVMEGVYVIAVLAKIKEGGWIPFAISIILAFIIGSQACFFYTNIQDGLTPILGHYIMNMRSLHEVMIFTTLQYLLVLKVASPERTVVKKLGLKGVYSCVIQYEYTDLLNLKGD